MRELEIRASDAEREVVAARLRTAAGEGRLEPDELDERLGAAFAARTRGGLAPLVADLPARRRRRRPHVSRRLTSYVAGNAALICLWMAEAGARHPIIGEGPDEFFWPIFPIVGWGLWLLRKRQRRLLPPA